MMKIHRPVHCQMQNRQRKDFYVAAVQLVLLKSCYPSRLYMHFSRIPVEVNRTNGAIGQILASIVSRF